MTLEQFSGFNQEEGMSEKAFEQFKEKWKSASAQISAAKKQEKKQKKKEDELVKILLTFIKKSDRQDLILLISRAIEQNIPANFILAIILLGNKYLKKEVGDYFMLKNPTDYRESNLKDESGGSSASNSDKSLIFFGEKDESLPLKVKIEMDNWMKNLLYQAQESPQKLLSTAYEIKVIEEKTESGDTEYSKQKKIKKALIRLVVLVISDYLEENSIKDQSSEQMKGFAKFIIKGILKKIEEELEGRKMLDE